MEGLREVVGAVVGIRDLSLDKESAVEGLSDSVQQQLFLLVDPVADSPSSRIHHQREGVEGCRPSGCNWDQVGEGEVVEGTVRVLVNRVSPINSINLIISQDKPKSPASNPVGCSHSSIPIKRIFVHVDDFSGVAAALQVVVELEGGGQLDLTVLWDKEGLVGVEEAGFTGLSL